MRQLALLALCFAGCVSDLAVGMSTGLVSDDDASIEDAAIEDAGRDLDASLPKIDSGKDPPVIYGDDASLPLYDAGARDAGRDAALYPKLCPDSACTQYLVMEGCDGGGHKVCAQPAPNELCELLCL